MKWPSSRFKFLLLSASICANIALIIVCGWLFQTAQSFYTDYRHFRALGIGTSLATTTPVSTSLGDTKTIVMFGDSRIEHWHPKPIINETRIINAGVSGETTTEMRRRFERDVLQHSPAIVVIQSGVNDLTASITKGIEDPQQLVDIMHENTRYFLETLQSNNIQAVVTSIFPGGRYSIGKKLFWHSTLQDKINHSNDVLRNMTEDSGGLWLDFSPTFYDSNGGVEFDLYRDTLHVNSVAYARLNEQLIGILSELE